MYTPPTFRMKPSGQVSWSYHMALYMRRRSRLVKKAKVMRIRPVICDQTYKQDDCNKLFLNILPFFLIKIRAFSHVYVTYFKL